MANDTLAQTLAWAQSFFQFRPVTQNGGTEPAVTSANIVQSIVMSPPFAWGWSRTEDTSVTTVAGTQDYTITTSTFGWIEKATLTDPTGAITEIKDVFNNKALSPSSQRARPNVVAVKSYDGTTLTLRLSPVPDKVYTVTVIYQQAPTALTATASTWSIPPAFRDIYAQLLASFLMDSVNDPRSQLYRRMGIAALLSKAEGLTETQVSAFLAIHLARDSQEQAAALRTQLGNQARSI